MVELLIIGIFIALLLASGMKRMASMRSSNTDNISRRREIQNNKARLPSTTSGSKVKLEIPCMAYDAGAHTTRTSAFDDVTKKRVLGTLFIYEDESITWIPKFKSQILGHIIAMPGGKTALPFSTETTEILSGIEYVKRFWKQILSKPRYIISKKAKLVEVQSNGQGGVYVTFQDEYEGELHEYQREIDAHAGCSWLVHSKNHEDNEPFWDNFHWENGIRKNYDYLLPQVATHWNFSSSSHRIDLYFRSNEDRDRVHKLLNDLIIKGKDKNG